MTRARRWGLSVPLDGIPLSGHADVYREAEAAGFTDAWSLEVDGIDCFTPLAIAAASTEHLRLGTAIANVFTRGPATLALSAAGLAEAAPGRFCLGIGAGSQTVVESWNSARFDLPLSRVRDTVTVLRAALRGERVSAHLKTLTLDGFRLSRPVEGEIPLYLAALGERMLRLAGEVGDGAIINWLAAADAPQSIAVLRDAARRAGRAPESVEVACRIFVCVDPPGPVADAMIRRYIAAYLNVPVYWAFQRWLGRGESLAGMHEAWEAGDRRTAVAAIPDEVARDLVIAGTPAERRARIQEYRAAGVDVPILHLMTAETDPKRRAEAMLRGFRESAPLPD